MSARDTFAVIGGSGAHQVLQKYAPNATRLDPIPTPFGLSGALYRFRIGSAHFLFLPRHGETGYEIAAPWVNYRANIYALKEQFKGTGLGFIRQHPVFCPEMHDAAVVTLSRLRVPYRPEGVYVCTEGPRLETRAEIRRYREWKTHLIGMTLAPECFLARELEMCYHPICYVTNYAEGVYQRQTQLGELFEGLLDGAEQAAVVEAVEHFPEIAAFVARALPEERACPCSLAMERYRREGRIGEDWHTWIGEP